MTDKSVNDRYTPCMDLRHPFRVVGPTLDGDILSVLARAEKGFTGREIQRALGVSQDGVRVAIRRLVSQGVVLSEPAGRAIMFSLNRQHLAAPLIEALAALRQTLIAQLRQEIEEWRTAPVAAILFGSAARGEAGPESDLDILIIRPAGVDADDDGWRSQIAALESDATSWTGNDTRVLEYGEDELPSALGEVPVIDDALTEGIELAGASTRSLRRRIA
jgi:DNA-binding transcriptional ArsR family regulator